MQTWLVTHVVSFEKVEKIWLKIVFRYIQNVFSVGNIRSKCTTTKWFSYGRFNESPCSLEDRGK